MWWVELDPMQGSEIKKTRPCVVITTNILNQTRRAAVVVPYSTAPRAAPPLTIPVSCAGRACVAVIDQIRTVTKERFRQRIGSADATEMESITESLRDILEIW